MAVTLDNLHVLAGGDPDYIRLQPYGKISRNLEQAGVRSARLQMNHQSGVSHGSSDSGVEAPIKKKSALSDDGKKVLYIDYTWRTPLPFQRPPGGHAMPKVRHSKLLALIDFHNGPRAN